MTHAKRTVIKLKGKRGQKQITLIISKDVITIISVRNINIVINKNLRDCFPIIESKKLIL